MHETASTNHQPPTTNNQQLTTNNQLSWESPYAIAQALHRAYPHRSLEDLSLGQLEVLIRCLDGFQDEPAPVNDEILLEIFQLWYEEQLYGSS